MVSIIVKVTLQHIMEMGIPIIGHIKAQMSLGHRR